MLFFVEKQVLWNALNISQGIISSRTNVPVLSYVLLRANKDNTLTITSTDLDVGIRVKIPAEVQNTGAVALNSRKLLDFVRELDNESIEFDVKKNFHAHITSGSVNVKFYGLPENEFPAIHTVKSDAEVSVSSDVLRNMFMLSSFAANKDNTRYDLNGVLLEFSLNGFRCVGSDGRRLSVIDISTKSIGVESSLIVPLKVVNEVLRFLPDDENVAIKIGENIVSFIWGDVEVISRVVDAEYPRYSDVIPDEKDVKMVIDRQKLLSALKRATIFVSVDSISVKMDLLPNKLVISKESQDFGTSREELSVDYSGEEFSIGVNPDYLIDVLKLVPVDEVGIEFFSPNHPIVIRKSFDMDGVVYKYIYVLSPIKI